MYRPEVGDKVTYNGWTKEQVRWGNNDTPYMLIVGRDYTITAVEKHRYTHTKCVLRVSTRASSSTLYTLH